MTGLWLSNGELTELNTMIVGVFLIFYLLQAVGVENRSSQSYLKPEILYDFRQLSELTIVTFRAM